VRSLIYFVLILIPMSVFAETIRDITKQVVNRTPYEVEVCTDQAVSGDKTKDTLTGAFIGGAIGNNVTKNVENGAAVGALIGGILGNQNSTATGGTRRVCQIETRYTEQMVTEYSHSEVTFTHEGKQYTLRFQK
jgi:uncharacterized protein YcfJ